MTRMGREARKDQGSNHPIPRNEFDWPVFLWKIETFSSRGRTGLAGTSFLRP